MIPFINIIALQTMMTNSYIMNNLMYLHSSGCCYLLKHLLLLPETLCFRSSCKTFSTLGLSSPFSFFCFFRHLPHLEPASCLVPVYCDRNYLSNSSMAGPWTGEGCFCLLIITPLAVMHVQKQLSKKLHWLPYLSNPCIAYQEICNSKKRCQTCCPSTSKP